MMLLIAIKILLQKESMFKLYISLSRPLRYMSAFNSNIIQSILGPEWQIMEIFALQVVPWHTSDIWKRTFRPYPS